MKPMEVKASYNRLQQLVLVGSNWLAQHKEPSKPGLSIQKVMSQWPDIEKKVQYRMTDADVDNALTVKKDEEDVLSKDDKGRLDFTKKLQHARNRDHRKIADNPDITVQVRFAPRVPKSMTELEIKTFAGLVFAADVVEAELARRDSEYDLLPDDPDEKPVTKTPDDQSLADEANEPVN